jgi:hypothetical protein
MSSNSSAIPPGVSAAAAALVNRRWQRRDGAQRTAETAPGRAAFLRRFLDQVDPDRVLTADEREARARQARRDHFAELGRKSGAARRGGAA